MKKSLFKRAHLFGVVLMAFVLLISTSSIATNHSKTLEAYFSGITVYFNGSTVTSAPLDDKVTEPFIVDGRIYLPLHTLCNALGQDVEWDDATKSVYIGARPGDIAALYRAAVLDAMVIDDDELFPLVEVTKDGPLCSWDDNGRVLMLTHHSYPDSYVAGKEYTLVYGAVWTFTDKEIIQWYKDNKDGVTDWELRFKQLIGLPPESTYTHFSAMWVNPDDIIRPGYKWELAETKGASSFVDEPSEEYKAWFDSNIIWSYFESAYPWTRLGYTYDWAAGGSDYGLSEFLVRKDAVTQVEFTMSTNDFVAWLEAQ